MKQLYYICISAFVTLLGCASDEIEELKSPVFEIEESFLQQDFKQEKSFVSIPITTSLASSEWQIKSNADWCKVSQSIASSKNSILLELKPNEEADLRTTTVEVKSSVKNYTINIRQLGYGKAILLKNTKKTIAATGGELTITVTANIAYELDDFSGDCDWITVNPSTRALIEYDHIFHVAANPNYESRTMKIRFVAKEDLEVSAECEVEQYAKSSSTDDVDIEDDILIKPASAIDTDHQPGQGIENCIDGVFNGPPYHSRWNGKTEFPVFLEFFFDGSEDIDYLIYYTRSGNGNFGKVNIYTATQEQPEYNCFGTFDFKQRNEPTKIEFNEPLQRVTKIKLEVCSGMGGYASCDEMQFFKRKGLNALSEQLNTVFTDVTCCELKSEVTIEQINALPGYFANIATHLKNDTYAPWEKRFRIQDYSPYSDTELWAERLMTKKYSNLDNPTGIYAEQGESIIVLVGDTYGQQITLQAIPSIEASGDIYFLTEGVNKIDIKRTGMLYVMYTADLNSPTARPIRIHIPLQSGKVNGYFDLKEHKTDEMYADLLSRATYKYFCIRGEKVIFYFHLSSLRLNSPNNILSAIHLWDNMIGWQQELMGIDDVRPSQVNNHIFAVSLDAEDEGYMWANDYRIAFNSKTLDRILLYDKVMSNKDNIWGPAHEVGHIHQEAINWPGSTEASNNLFSNYALYNLGKYCSRGAELSVLATQRCQSNAPWIDLKGELKMRMYWQLWNYFHLCGYDSDFYQNLFKELRNDRGDHSDPGAAQLHFVEMACKVANMDLTDFFETWGFFVPVNKIIEQYGTWKYEVTSEMISKTKQMVAKYPNQKHAFQYLEDRKDGDEGIDNYKVGDVGYYSLFKDNRKITKQVSYVKSGQRITIQNGDEAVAFEIRDNKKLVFFSNFLSFELPSSKSLADDEQIFAVQADGTRKLLYEGK